MTRKDFILDLCSVFGEDAKDLLHRGQKNGWLEFEDELFLNDQITRKNIARIIHMYLVKKKGISDLQDVSDAEVLRDLYDCRACANHVAQVYLRGIMGAKDLAVNGGFLWFDLDGTDNDADIRDYLFRASKICRLI